MFHFGAHAHSLLPHSVSSRHVLLPDSHSIIAHQGSFLQFEEEIDFFRKLPTAKTRY